MGEPQRSGMLFINEATSSMPGPPTGARLLWGCRMGRFPVFLPFHEHAYLNFWGRYPPLCWMWGTSKPELAQLCQCRAKVKYPASQPDFVAQATTSEHGKDELALSWPSTWHTTSIYPTSFCSFAGLSQSKAKKACSFVCFQLSYLGDLVSLNPHSIVI